MYKTRILIIILSTILGIGFGFLIYTDLLLKSSLLLFDFSALIILVISLVGFFLFNQIRRGKE